MTPDELRALADALSRQRQADEHGIYCAVPRQAVDAAIKYLRAQADAQPVAWMYEHDGCVDTPLFTVNRWTKCEEPWNESPLFLHPAPAAPQAEPCIGNNPTCPCQDGDACHYRDAADGTKGWPVPQAEPIDPHMIVAEDRFPDVPAEQWVTCSQCDGDFDRECPICDGLGRVLATDGEQAEPKREPLPGLTPTHRCPACGALWRQCDDASWNLRSASCCGLCDAGRVELVRWLDEPKRKPLGDWRIAEEATNRQMTAACEDAFYDGVRWAESAHGIGGSDAE